MAESVPPNSARMTFQNSEYPQGIHRQSEDMMNDSRMTLSNVGAGRQTEFKITAMEPDDGAPPERRQDYKGRLRTWPGIVLFVGIVAAAATLMTMGALNSHDKATAREKEYEENVAGNRKIQDGISSTDDLVDDDGQVGNPKSYPDMGCELPDYQSKNGKIYAVAKNGTEVAVGIKGVNWFGMETGSRIPYGLWENSNNGTTAYEIASFLARNKYNSVRFPLCIKSILSDEGPSKSLINVNSNRAINITTYMSTIKSIVETLAYRKITVMLSLHTLDTQTSGGAWYSSTLGVTEDDFLDAVDILTKNLCSADYWNILGLDLKNEPHECSWGGAAPDWQKGAKLIGNRMLKGCPNWMAFVEGINGPHKITLTGRAEATYYDWWGGGLQDAGDKPVTLSIENKVVWAPHYYNTGVTPAWYLYDSTTSGADSTFSTYVESDNETLKANVEATFNDMFGYLAKNKKEAVVLGEFAGLYSKDLHPKKTTKRTTDYSIVAAIDAGFAGGYMWSLNPESAYQFNPADTRGTWTEGLLEDDWLTPNKEFLAGMAAMDALPDLRMFPCFPVETSS